MSEIIFKVTIPLNEAIKMGFEINPDRITVNGKNLGLTNNEISKSIYVLMISFYVEPWATSFVQVEAFESDHFEEDLDEVTNRLLGISYYAMILNEVDYPALFKEKCKYNFTIN